MNPGAEVVNQLAKDLFEEIRQVRRHLHMHPELSFKEFETSKFVQSKLKERSLDFKAGFVKTGILVTIKGRNPSKKTVLLRGDMDALPIEEKNEVPYRSKNKGVMHACGHDVHTSCALGAAFILNELKDRFEGTVKVMFQPGEEVTPGGASLMINEGILEDPKVDHAIALHVFPSMDAGHVGFRGGMYMASTDELYLTVKGKGGHAAMPHDYVNPLLIASELLLAINNRFMTPEGLRGGPGEHIPTVVAFGKIEGKGATNVIPDEVTVEGTFRTMNEDWRHEVHAEVGRMVEFISGKYGIRSELRVVKGYPFLVNDERFTKQCFAAAQKLVGENKVHHLPIRMTAEDFAFITQRVPSCFFRLGTDNKEKGITSGVHTATFDADERCLETGMAMMAWLALDALSA